MANNIKKKMKLFRSLDKSISMQSSNRTQTENNNYFLKEGQNQRNPILIKSYSRPKEEKRDSVVSSEFKLRCKSALRQSESFKPMGQRISTSLYRTRKPVESQDENVKTQGQLQQIIKCKQIIKQSNKIHQDRWKLLSSIEIKLVQEMQPNILKRQLMKSRFERSAEITQEIKAKSLIKFNDLIQIKQVQVEKQTYKKQGKKIKLVGNKTKKKSAVLSRTQPSFSQTQENNRNTRMANTWKFFSRGVVRFSLNQQEITGWQTPADT